MQKRGMALGHEAGTLQVTHPAYASTCPFRLFKGLLSSQLCGGKQQLLLCPWWFPSSATVTHIPDPDKETRGTPNAKQKLLPAVR